MEAFHDRTTHLSSSHPPSRSYKFRFKSSHHKSTSMRDGNDDIYDDADRGTRLHRRHHHHHRRHHHRRRRPRSVSPEDFYTSSRRRRYPTTPSPPVSPDTAFRQSLFDALADDEGALYWESVYGQPLHTYDRPHIENELGELEQMSDEEYAAHVREKMWEKTHEGFYEEQQARRRLREESRREDDERKERKRRKRHTSHQHDHDHNRYDHVFDIPLCRDSSREHDVSDRRKIDRWKEIWTRYLHSWDELNAYAVAMKESADQKALPKRRHLRNLIHWPVESGKRSDITRETVEDFMRNAQYPSQNPAPKEQQANDILATLKAERVRWHPDKIQQRYGSLELEEQVVKSVTTVFQIIDALFIEAKGKG